MANLEQESSEALLDILQQEYEEGYVHSTKHGDEFIFDCPFCGGDTRGPCFHFNIYKGVGHCWRASCSWEGNYNEFLQQVFNWNEFEVLEKLKLRSENDWDVLKRKLFKKENETFNISTNHQEHTFLQGSIKITPENLDVYPDVKEFLRRRRYEASEFVMLHDVYWPPQYGMFKDRLLFLIRTKANYTYLAYTMLSGEKLKTINAPESSMLEFLYNYNDAIDADVVFVAEGIFDCARILTYKDVIADAKVSSVALLGTRIGEGESQSRAHLLRDCKAREIVICLDSDAKDNAWKIYHYLKKHIPDKDISVMDLSFGIAKYRDLDPDDCDKETFKKSYEKRYIKRSLDSSLQAFRRSFQ